MIRSPSPRQEHPSPGPCNDEDDEHWRGGSSLNWDRRVRIQPSRFGGVSRFDRYDGKGKTKGRGKSSERVDGNLAWSASGGGGSAASLEPAWQVHARRRRRVARAILAAAAARGVAAPPEVREDNAPTLRPRPPEDEGPPPAKGKGKSSSRGGYQVSSTRVHVSNLPRDITEGNLEHLFGQHGHVLGLQLLTASGRSGGPGQICAIIRYPRSADAEAAIVALHNKHEVRPGDGPIVVKLAKPNPRWDN